jgi:hypothetical protein
LYISDTRVHRGLAEVVDEIFPPLARADGDGLSSAIINLFASRS